MRLLLFVLGVIAAVVCIEKHAEAQNSPGCAYYNKDGGARNCGFATLEQCLTDVRGVGGSCGPSPYYQRPYYKPYRSGYRY
jgi:uncharacterized protein DUF3551